MFEYMEDFYFEKFSKIADSIWEDEHKIDTPNISGEKTNINEKIEYTFSLSGAMDELEEDEKKKYEEYIKIWTKKFIDIIEIQEKNNPLVIWHENTDGTKIIMGLIDMQNKRIVK